MMTIADVSAQCTDVSAFSPTDTADVGHNGYGMLRHTEQAETWQFQQPRWEALSIQRLLRELPLESKSERKKIDWLLQD